MTQRALIQNGRVHEILSPDAPPWPEGGEAFEVEAPDTVRPRFGFRDGKFIEPKNGVLAGDPDDFHENFLNAQIAKQEYLISDRVLVRFYEQESESGSSPGSGVSQEWKDYRNTLRSMILLEFDTTTAPIPLPPRPPVPWPDQLLPSG